MLITVQACEIGFVLRTAGQKPNYERASLVPDAASVERTARVWIEADMQRLLADQALCQAWAELFKDGDRERSNPKLR